MKKADLEIEIKRLQEEVVKLRKEKSEFENLARNLTDGIPVLIENAMYEKFKNENGKFLDRFMKEWMSEHVSIEINGDNCSNYVDAALYVDDEKFSESTGSISVTGIASESYW